MRNGWEKTGTRLTVLRSPSSNTRRAIDTKTKRSLIGSWLDNLVSDHDARHGRDLPQRAANRGVSNLKRKAFPEDGGPVTDNDFF